MLRQAKEFKNFKLRAHDGDIGKAREFLFDDRYWTVRYLVVDTKNWWSGKHIVISPQWIERVSWPESMVIVNLSREIIRQSPDYTPDSLNRGYEIELHRHYGRNMYWAEEPAAHKEHQETHNKSCV